MILSYPDSPVRNQAYTIYFPIYNGTADFSGTSTAVIAGIGIAKDGVWASPTNSAVYSSSTGMFKITLTASEMDGDIIKLKIVNANSNPAPDLFIILKTSTSVSSSGGMNQTDALTEDGVLIEPGTVGDVLKAMYYFLRKNKNRKTIPK